MIDCYFLRQKHQKKVMFDFVLSLLPVESKGCVDSLVVGILHLHLALVLPPAVDNVDDNQEVGHLAV